MAVRSPRHRADLRRRGRRHAVPAGREGPDGRRIPADVEITESRPNELHAFRATEGPVRPEGRYELSPANGSTRVRFALAAEVPGLKKLLSPMVQRTMEREVAGLERLKQVLES